MFRHSAPDVKGLVALTDIIRCFVAKLDFAGLDLLTSRQEKKSKFDKMITGNRLPPKQDRSSVCDGIKCRFVPSLQGNA